MQTLTAPISLPTDAAKTKRTTFKVLHEERIHFEGTANELLASRDRYLQEFLFMTLPPW